MPVTAGDLRRTGQAYGMATFERRASACGRLLSVCKWESDIREGMAIAERVRGVIERQAARDLEAIARSLALPEQDFRRLIEDRERMIDVGFLIDLLAAMVRVFGLDPQWLLVGTYHAGSHRLALELVETSGHTGEHTLREFLHEQYRRLRAGLGPWFLTAQ